MASKSVLSVCCASMLVLGVASADSCDQVKKAGTCADMKKFYKAAGCCGKGDSLQHVGFSLVPNPSGQRLNIQTSNPCAGKKPDGAAWKNKNCGLEGVLEQSGRDVSGPDQGKMNVGGRTPITANLHHHGPLCPVNVHWHTGAEHRSAGEFDETGKQPAKPEKWCQFDDSGLEGRRLEQERSHEGRRLAKERDGLMCSSPTTQYVAGDTKFTKPYEWKYCKNMQVGMTYEVHWPSSSLGECGRVWQFQTPFYDGVFCNYNVDAHGGLTEQQIAHNIGVQAQIFRVVNDERYFYPDLLRGMIIGGNFGKNMAYYTGSTTGTSRNNEVCSKFTPITWQVDRKCHLLSASSFDKLCFDMLQQPDDMSGDVHPHGARELVNASWSANNLHHRNGHAGSVAPASAR